MVKSNSCFRLITCVGDAAEKDNHQVASEINDSNDKRGWSFRKKSARHRVLSNTVTTETPPSANKETSECISINNFQTLSEPNVVEKICTTNFSDEKPQLSSVANSEMSETIVSETEGKVEVNLPESVEGNVGVNLPESVEGKVDVDLPESVESDVDINLPESVVIIFQAAIRGYLAQRALLKSKNVVKLQAAFRGHLVRRHAVGTLRCVQAIIKMQLLVRARHAQQTHSEDRLNHNDGKNDYSKTLDNEHNITKSNVVNTRVEKLLNNKFARQLLESTPKNKPIRVKCDPSKADSAWKWLERWMSVSAKDSPDNKKPICSSEQSDEIEDSSRASHLETRIPSEVSLQLAYSKPTEENEEKTAFYDASDSNFQASPSTLSLVKDNFEQARPGTTDEAKVASTEIDSFENEKTQLDASEPQEPISPPQEPEIDSFENEKAQLVASEPQEPISPPQEPEIDFEQCKQSTKTFSSDQLETDDEKIIRGSRKFSNPAFIAAQSKFEELSSMTNSGRSQPGSKEIFSSENSAPYPSRIGGSEAGTELTVSSTLESPDRSDVETMESEHDAKELVQETVNPENEIEHFVEADTLFATPTSSLPISDLNQLETVNDTDGSIVDSVVLTNSKEPEKNSSELLREHMETVSQDFKLSPEASPASHMTIPESQEGTPSSQVSAKPKGNKINKTGSSNRRRKLSVGNKSPMNTNNNDSGSKVSKEKLPKNKDQVNGKRRNSFGSIKADHTDQEATDNSNNNSLPRFMQVTESAKAKITANSSPRASPDVHDHDIHSKKRHSLPGATGRQGSPLIERSPPLVQPSTKGSGSHEKKWQR